ncbi:helix-turn-helix transcriptional regulator [Muricauda sp. SCSIO 64092]|uniref:helix-turn-helix domain-containing protein n=1 Tax=Allomuricauda sp. SCSIO 64092 TaxID=2908842 RepID=UPI001FF19E0F|nr:helix-turn-helix transcriptional regulator [Muricauda sp. SCSIO 64092]UOY08881.1 helix-turn-helix transcriptional regulator [Muricauda sp. SCSIO 64092]
MDIDNNLKYNIEFILKNRKLTQSDLGKLIGSNQRQISNWLTGKTRVPIEMLVAIAANFDLSTDKLLFDRLDNPYSQDTTFEKANHGLTVSDYNEEGPSYEISEKKIANKNLLNFLQSILGNEESVAILTSFLTKNHQFLKNHSIYGMYVKQMKLEGENEKDELWLDVREKISESKLKQIMKILDDKKVNQ